jgi:F-type H+-transporting ATPase subunit delta
MEEIARVYSRSLFEVAQDRGNLDVLHEQLGAFADALDSNRELATFFFSPYFSTKEKDDSLKSLLVDADPTLVNFIGVLIDGHRMPVIFRIRRDFDLLWEQAHRRLPVEVTSAISLDEQTLKRLSDEIGRRTGEEVSLTTRVDPDILGGLIVRIGNSILDASIRNRLEQLRKQVARSA